MRVVGQDVAYAMPWAALKRMITDKYYPRESAKVERYIGGLPDMIHGNVRASKPQLMQEAIEFATEMMDKKMLTHAERIMRHRHTLLGNEIRSLMEGPNLYVPIVIIITMGPVHQSAPTVRRLVIWPVIVKADLLLPTTTPTTTNQRAQGANARGVTCYECGVLGHYKSDCPKLKNGNKGNRAGNENVVARVYVVGTTRTNPNSNVVTGKNPDTNVVTGTFLLNNCYASILFDTSFVRSFVSTAFSSLIYIVPTALDHDYDVKLAGEKIIRFNTIIRVVL
nr:hypothetical protein [Tanacetum cinerariifolium]